MKLFEEILKESKQDGIELFGGVTAYCRKSKSGERNFESRSPYYDLILQGPSGKRVIEDWATYRTGWPQTYGSPSEMGYFLETTSGYSAGNGSQRSRPEVPSLKYYRHIADHIMDHYQDEILDVYSPEK